MAEEHVLLQDTRPNGATIINRRSGTEMAPEKTPFLAVEPVRLTPAWEGSNLPNDQLNLKGVTMERAVLEMEPPKDRWNLIYITLLIHGIGTLTPWNMFITATNYFEKYKLSGSYFAKEFSFHVSLCSQIPNLFFNWCNIFIEIKGNLTRRIIISLLFEVLIFVVTVILAMVDTREWTSIFYYTTLASVVFLNALNGVFQNSVYGVAARLPPKYTGAVVLGSNISGCLASVASILATMFAPSIRTSAVYYFITALFVLLACFDTYFALPLNRFYRYHELMAEKAAQRSTQRGSTPYFKIFCRAFPQLLNVFIVLFVTLVVFPSVHGKIRRVDENFFIRESYFEQVTCFLTFNIGATLGSFTATLVNWPSPRYLWIFTWARLVFIPLMLVCNYQPLGEVRTLPVYITNDWVYWVIAMLYSWSSGHFSSLAMMYVSKTAETQYTAQAGMFAAAMLITGIVSGILTSFLAPLFVTWSIFAPTT